MIRRSSIVIAAVLLLAACGSSSATDDGLVSKFDTDQAAGTESAVPLPSEAETTSPPGTYLYRACPRGGPARGTTHLRATDLPVDGDVVVRGSRVTLEHATDLVLLDGTVRSGNGYDGATGGGGDPLRVAREPVTAPVTLAVINGPNLGRRVAFLEVQVRPATPVRWAEASTLGIVTDGGDGAFIRGGALGSDGSDEDINDYVGAFYPDGDSTSGNVCVLAVTRAGDIDSVMFSTGIGDGSYATFAGYDEAGEIVSLVSYGGLVPWSASGLPGTPLPADALG